ncbi:MAG: twin-arginine translocase subunit TatC [Bacilli bacterium]
MRSMSFATPIVVYFYVGFLGALGLSLPVVFYLAAKFIAPGLTNQELKMLRPGVIAAIILFCVGACFAFFFILPMGIAFMSWLSQGMQLEMFPDAQSYYSMVIFVTIAIGVTFQLPLLEFILIYLGVLNVQWLKKNRRIVFLLILIFATVVTPPDALTQISLTIPLYLMYEITLFLGQRARSKKLAREARAERLAELRDERERKEYVEMMAKERLAEEKAEAEESEIDPSIDTSHYSLPDDYDPNEIHPTPKSTDTPPTTKCPTGKKALTHWIPTLITAI